MDYALRRFRMNKLAGITRRTLVYTSASIILAFLMVFSLLPHDVLAQSLRSQPDTPVAHQAEVELSIVTVSPPLEISASSAMLKCDLVSLGAEDKVQVGFEYSGDSSFGNVTELQEMTTTGSVSMLVQDLKPETAYHYRAKAAGSAGEVYGEEAEFTTLPEITPSPEDVPAATPEPTPDDNLTPLPANTPVSTSLPLLPPGFALKPSPDSALKPPITNAPISSRIRKLNPPIML
jgi:hypothetical protein